jgi:hypothetical protein
MQGGEVMAKWWSMGAVIRQRAGKVVQAGEDGGTRL